MNEWDLNETDLFDLYGCSSTLIARAANKKLVEWLFEYCDDDSHYPFVVQTRRACYKCLQSLKKELGIK